MELIVLILAILIEVWFSIFRVQLQKEQKVGRGREVDSHPQVLQLLPWPAALTAPGPFLASLSAGTRTPD